MKRLPVILLLCFGCFALSFFAAPEPCPDTVSISCTLSPNRLYQSKKNSNEFNLVITDSIVGQINRRKGDTQRDFIRSFSPTFNLVITQTPHFAGCSPRTYRIDTIRIQTAGFQSESGPESLSQSVHINGDRKGKHPDELVWVPASNGIPLGGPSAKDQSTQYSRKISFENILRDFIKNKEKSRKLVLTFRAHLVVNIVGELPITVPKTITINIIRREK